MARNAQTYVQTNYDWDRIAETLRLYTALSTSLDKSGVPVQHSNKLVKALIYSRRGSRYYLEAGLVTQKQVEVALAEQEVIQMRLGEILVQRDGSINRPSNI